MGVNSDDDSSNKRGQEVNVRQIGDGKATEKERVPYNFDDVIGGEQEKKKGGHHADTPGLAGPDVEKARQSVCQRNVIHEINWIAILKTKHSLWPLSHDRDEPHMPSDAYRPAAAESGQRLALGCRGEGGRPLCDPLLSDHCAPCHAA
jgi:hypothetical protein